MSRQRFWDGLMVGAAISGIAVAFFYENGAKWAVLADWALVGIFAVDAVLEFRRRAKESRSHLSQWVDLMGMLPLAFAPGFLRLLRLGRIWRVVRTSNSLGSSCQMAEAVAKRSRFGIFASVLAAAALLAATLVYFAEQATNPNIDTPAEALWWTIVTITTVGYGDSTPVTAMGRVVAAFLMIVGVGMVGALASVWTAAILRGDANTVEQSSVSELERLWYLHKDNGLSAEEYHAAKTTVLREMEQT